MRWHPACTDDTPANCSGSRTHAAGLAHNTGRHGKVGLCSEEGAGSGRNMQLLTPGYPSLSQQEPAREDGGAARGRSIPTVPATLQRKLTHIHTDTHRHIKIGTESQAHIDKDS